MHLLDSSPSLLFELVECLILLGSLGVVCLANIIYASIVLGFVFINIALLYLLMNADFLAAAQVVIYVGAINVLLLFAIMLVNIPERQARIMWVAEPTHCLPALAATGIFVLLLSAIVNTLWCNRVIPNHGHSSAVSPLLSSSVHTLGIQLFSHFLLPFELLSILLLIALIGAITMAKNTLSSR